jgi:predicted MPP superfamily phosphohydrolase
MLKMIQEKEEVDFIAVTGDLVSGQMDEHNR